MRCTGYLSDFTITYIQNIVKHPYKRNMRVIFVSIIPYSQYILIYNIDKPIKIGDTRKRVISIWSYKQYSQLTQCFLIIQNKMYIWISIIINHNISLRKRSIFSTYSFLILYNHLNLTIKYNSSYFNTYQILYSNFYLLYEILFILSYNLSFLCVHLMYI